VIALDAEPSAKISFAILASVIRRAWSMPMLFDTKSVEGTKIKEEDEYDGVRIKFQAELAGARIPMQIDIGFGDDVSPEPELLSFPVLLSMEAPLIRAYPREASIAEKFHAMVKLDIRNSRMKDFYDIWFMAKTWTFDMASLRKASLRSTRLAHKAVADGSVAVGILNEDSPCVIMPCSTERSEGEIPWRARLGAASLARSQGWRLFGQAPQDCSHNRLPLGVHLRPGAPQ
jgi:hypothetical protein